MKTVFKFGGASIQDVNSIKSTCNIIKKHEHEKLFVVFSAMGKVTNMLEEVVNLYVMKDSQLYHSLEKVKVFHYDILNELFDIDELIFSDINNLFIEIEWLLEENPIKKYSYYYDQIVSVGELLSSKILSAYLNKIGFNHQLIDARDIIRTDDVYRNAKINWNKTTSLIKNKMNQGHYLTQGFIGCTSQNVTTTLGREGSDFTAAILGFVLDVNEVVIWKDVPGMMNADPNSFSKAKLFSNVSFDEAIELAFFGAKVVHPRTIQPLKQKNIPLRVKSFIDPKAEGTLIAEGVKTKPDLPSYIIKEDQVLISISDPRLSFIVEDHMKQIFLLLTEHSISVNMMQNSAVSFSICIDNDKYTIPKFIQDLQKEFKVSYNESVRLYTIRNYNSKVLKEFLNNRVVLLEQRSRNTLQVVAF